MAYSDLRDFIAALEKHGELKRVSIEVDPVLEITEFADRSVKSQGPALLFENPKGSRIPVLINAFASMRRMELALEVDSVDVIAGRISEYLEMRMPEGLIGKLKMLPKLAEMGSFFPRRVSSGPCKEVIRKDNFSLLDYPILKCWPQDGGRFITLPMVFSRNPDTGKRNCGCYRMQIYDERTAGMHWQTHKQGAEHYRRREKSGQKGDRMDVAVAIGSDPATMYSAILPLPPDLDEMMIAGFIRGKPVEMVPCETSDLEVPANAEIVLEGYVPPERTHAEGPFGEWTGHYAGGVRQIPVLDIKAIYYRNDPIVLGVPPMGAGPDEMARYRAVMRSATIKQNVTNAGVPGVQAVWCHEVGGARMLHAVSITQRYPGHAVQAAHVAAQCGASAYASKYIVVVDEDVDVTNLDHLLWAMLTRTDPKESIQFITGSWDSSADPALPPERRAVGNMTHSVALIDACKPWHWRDKFPPTNAPSPEVTRKAREKFGWLLDGNGAA